jgi:hypothetical protein
MLRVWISSALTASVIAFAAPVKAQIIIETCTPFPLEYCYENGLDTVVTFYCSDPLSQPLMLLVCAGEMELCCDILTIYDGMDETYPILFLGNNGGNMAGMTVVCTNPENALTVRITTNDSIDCDSEGYVPLNWAVGPMPVTDCAMGVVEADGHNDALLFTQQNGQFIVHWPSMRSTKVISQLSDMAGRERWSGQLKFDASGQAIFPMNGIESGAFVLRVMADGRVPRPQGAGSLMGTRMSP